MPVPGRRSLSQANTYLLFGLTGIGQVLPGTLLPLLAAHWRWNDSRSGWLFFLFFLGSSMGAFASRGTLGRMLGLAALAISAPVAVLDQLAGPPVFFAVLLYGFGLGVGMTSISLLQSRRRAADRLAELARLNLVWAAGACSGPLLLLRSTAVFGLSVTLRGYAAVVLVTGAALCALLWTEPVPPTGTWQAWRRMRDLPVFFAVTLPLVTGIESSVGAWLTTYAERVYKTSGILITAITALWAGLLISRLLFAGRLAALLHRRGIITGFAALPVLGLGLLLGDTNPALAALGSFLVGFGIGPIYPYLLSVLLDVTEAGNSGFLAAGAGAATLPLLTGQLSQSLHSLRFGLFVPLLGSAVLAGVLSRGQVEA